MNPALQRLDAPWLCRDIGHTDPPCGAVHTVLLVRHRETSLPNAHTPAARMEMPCPTY